MAELVGGLGHVSPAPSTKFMIMATTSNSEKRDGVKRQHQDAVASCFFLVHLEEKTAAESDILYPSKERVQKQTS